MDKQARAHTQASFIPLFQLENQVKRLPWGLKLFSENVHYFEVYSTIIIFLSSV